MTNEEMGNLINQYFNTEGYTFPGDFEHRVDPDSSAMIYSLLRQYQPTSCLQAGCWYGGTTCVIMAALLKNGKDFGFVASELLDDKKEATERHCLTKNGRAPIMLGDITKNLQGVPKVLDFLFVDTDHDLETTEWIVENLFPRVKKGSLVVFHDWAVEEIDGKWSGKGDGGVGGWPETQYIMDLHHAGKLPLKKLFWNWKNPGSWETGAFIKT